jgi:hypothetical protein
MTPALGSGSIGSLSSQLQGYWPTCDSWEMRRSWWSIIFSNAAQAVGLDLRRVNIRIEMFGKNIFRAGGEVPYLLTLGPYHYLLFSVAKNLK